ncbi:hypothetical protein [Halorubrum vacuolatum]|uniref:HTH iclR-type domain-containing protein n=1 Tax=Halorubrum vacuolatum TaxID=63740 RepID=A0A238WUD4_HALVU|nr:hypothetical protein [Halorubrum vacuolatum]SNR49854.1 hypothetical protein SAMN06264855_11027 [Halorubrum vacuolatum]
MAQSVERALIVMEIMDKYQRVGEPVSVSEVEDKVDFSEDTVRRRLDDLVKRGWAYKKGEFYFPMFQLGKSGFYKPDKADFS